ncbi:MAG: hypothetical protein HY675_06740 [Chloroflexi bacterium]|nr:hypothetical protein [Chloroflexota bacterium]
MPDPDQKSIVAAKAQQLIDMTAAFCDKFLDEEYRQLCEKLIRKMARKRNVPFLPGRPNLWAAATIYALGQVNFLFDKSFQPYATPDDICDHFGTSKSTTSQKAKALRDMFKLDYWDKEFSTARMNDDDPLRDMVMVDGLIVPIDSLPPGVRDVIRRSRR